MAGAGARAHAERFLAACPEDVREARHIIIRAPFEEFLIWVGPTSSVVASFDDDGGCQFSTEGGSIDDVQVTHIDRLLGGA